MLLGNNYYNKPPLASCVHWVSLVLIWCCLWLAGQAQATATPTQADSSFVVEDIIIEGLQRVDDVAAFDNLPLRVGDEIDQRTIATATRRLFQSGYFDDLNISRVDNQLLIKVQRATCHRQLWDYG